ncbi:hypothetical protein WJX84_010000, partial [Apatococcus fuscideae]
DLAPTVPDEVTSFMLRTTGSSCDDIRLVRLISLSAQKLLASICHDAYQIHKRKLLSLPKPQRISAADRRPVLTSEDLAEALQEHGFNLRRPAYFVDPQTAGPSAQ